MRLDSKTRVILLQMFALIVSNKALPRITQALQHGALQGQQSHQGKALGERILLKPLRLHHFTFQGF